MSATWLDFSQQRDLALHARVLADLNAVIESFGVVPLIVGAFARDLHLQYNPHIKHKITITRKTSDIDFAVSVPDWPTFQDIRNTIIANGKFISSNHGLHRLQHHSGLPIDLVPFGSVETADRKIHWPPEGHTVMDAFGFREASLHAIDVTLPESVNAKLVSLPGLALLKIISWEDRIYPKNGKDATDLNLIVRSYLYAGNEERLFEEFIDWTQEDGFDNETYGARMLGYDMQRHLKNPATDPVTKILTAQSDPDSAQKLPSAMDQYDPERARRLLAAVLTGLRLSVI